MMKYLIEGGHDNMGSQDFLCNLVSGGVLLNGMVKIFQNNSYLGSEEKQ